MAFFLFETLTGLRVHPIQYLLVGAALVLFYLILLAFSEHLGFALAPGGQHRLQRSDRLLSERRTARQAARCAVRREPIAVVRRALFAVAVGGQRVGAGAGLLFAILAGIMLLTRKLDWYQVADPARLAKETPAGEDEPRFRLWK